MISQPPSSKLAFLSRSGRGSSVVSPNRSVPVSINGVSVVVDVLGRIITRMKIVKFPAVVDGKKAKTLSKISGTRSANILKILLL